MQLDLQSELEPRSALVHPELNSCVLLASGLAVLSVHIQTDTISTRAVLLVQNKGITDTLMIISVPLVGRVTANTLIASSVPLGGGVIMTDSLSKSPVRGRHPLGKPIHIQI